MTQVTDEMVEAAQQATRRDGFGIMPHSEVRAALEAALAVREKDSDGLTDDQIAYCHERADHRRAEWRNDLVARLRRQSPAIGIVDSGVPNTIMDQAADLIERQAEEIAWLQLAIANREESVLYAKVDEMAGIVERLTAERAELIEALRPFSEWSLELKGMDDDNLLLATYDKEREDNRFGTVGDCRRARALLERLGANEVG